MLLPARPKRNRRLTPNAAPAKDGQMKKLLLALIAPTALAACDQQDHTIVAGGTNAEPVNTAGVVLPPSIAASKTYRCKDNSLVYIDWLSDNLTANFRAARSDAPVQLKAPVMGEPLVAEGYALTGAQADASITLTRPGMGAQACKA